LPNSIPKPKIDPKKQRENMARGFYQLDSPTFNHQRVRAQQAARVPRIVHPTDIDRLLPDDGGHDAFEAELDRFIDNL
jgi:hypothetical protein